ncbi:MAG: ATP-binding cassette domain-containing protein [Candidatus Izemoplasmatales bacterium]|nr:ATP-binding cassette domain-containing protein [Candidatus Izemoplasmatales bacterium]
MAKIWNSVSKIVVAAQIKKFQTSQDFFRNYLPEYIQKKEMQLLVKKQNLDLKFNQLILPYEIKAHIDSSYVKESFEYAKKQIEGKYYWKERALKQTILRKQQMNTEQGNSLIQNLQRQFSEELKKNELKFYPENVEKDALTDYQTFYQMQKTNYDLKTKKQIDKFEHTVSKQKNSIEKKITQSQKKLELLGPKLRSFENAVGKYSEEINEKVVLKLDHLSMHFGGLKAVDDLSFEVKKGEIFGLIGPNGAGKTTVFNCITRFYKPTHGTMIYRNHLNEAINLNDYKVHNVIKEGIVRTFQNVELIWELNVIENLLVAAHTKYQSGFFGHLFNSRLLRQEEIVMKKKAQKILEDLELANYQYFYPLGLPYGILKKVELARTLMVNPTLIILDEPAAGLNDTETVSLAKTIKKIQKDYHTTIFLVEHDMGLVMEICDTICAISFGKKLAIGTPSEIQKNKLVREAYLGGE